MLQSPSGIRSLHRGDGSALTFHVCYGCYAMGDSLVTIRSRIGCVPLIGRSDELATIRFELEAAFRGKPRMVMLSGPAGIGKSRLLAEAITAAGAVGGLGLLGRCLDERGMPPYLPWIDAFAPHDSPPPASFRQGGEGPSVRPERDGVDGGPSETERALHDLWAIFTLDDPEGRPQATSASPEQGKLRLFQTVTRAVGRLAQERPLLLAFDDLQWSDAASNELLRYVVIHSAPAPLLVLGAYRAEEAPANPELVRTIDELQRRRLAITVPVGPFDITATESLVTDLLQHDNPALAAAIHHHAEGNPFITEEVLRTLVDEGRLDPRGAIPPGSPITPGALPLPDGVVAIVAHRLERLSERTRALLELAALTGREIATEWVAAAAGAEPSEVAALLEEAARAALVRPVEDDAPRGEGLALPIDYAFLHDRVREAMVAQINPVRRRELHGRLASALEAMGDRGDELAWLAALTHHYRLAHQPEHAVAAAERLGEASMRAHAHAEAVRAFRVAVELAPEATSRGGGRPELGALLLKLGDAALAAGAGDAIDAYARAKAVFAEEGDRHGLARVLHRLGTAHARREELDLAIAYLEAALAALQEIAQDADEDLAENLAFETVQVLVELGSVLGTSLARYEEAIAVGRRALALTQTARDSPATEAHARLALAKTLMRAGDLEGGHTLLSPALSLALRADQPLLAAEVAGALANHGYWVGDLDASERAAQRRRDLALRAGDPFALRHVVPWLANLALARGEWAEAERLLAEAEPQVDRIESPEPHAFLRQLAGLLHFQQGRYSEALALLEEAAAGFRDCGPATLVWYLGCLAQAHLASGDLTATQRVADETETLVAMLPPGSLPRAPALAQLGIVAARRGDVTSARRWYEALAPYTGQHHWVLVDRVRGMLAALLGDEPAAERHFAAAAAIATRGGMWPELALTLAEHGALLRRSQPPGNRRDGERRLLDALRLLDRLGMADHLVLVEAPLPTTNDNDSQAVPAGLTEREVEVLRLVAQGLTNREIADRLAISEKTVANHLTHAFTKANLDNRAAAVAFAFRHRLV